MKSVDQKYSLVLILLIFFGVFFAGVLIIATVLTFFLHRRKRDRFSDNDTESEGSSSVKSSDQNYELESNKKLKRKRYHNILYARRSKVKKKFKKKNAINKTRISNSRKTKYFRDKIFKCQNNNTHCSNLFKSMKSSLQLSISTSKESLSDHSSLNDSDNFLSSTSTRKVFDLKKFKPLCTSSPMQLIQKSSPNTTFNLNKSMNASHSTDSELHSLKNQSVSGMKSFLNCKIIKNDLNNLDQSTGSFENLISQVSDKILLQPNAIEKTSIFISNSEIQNTVSSITQQHLNNSKSHFDYPVSDNLFDPKDIYIDIENLENYRLSNLYFHDVVSMCCRKSFAPSNTPYSNYDSLLQSFGEMVNDLKYGCTKLELFDEHVLSNIVISFNQINFITHINELNLSQGLYHNNHLLIKQSFSVALSMCSVEVKNSIFLHMNCLILNSVSKLSSEATERSNVEQSTKLFDTTIDQWLVTQMPNHFPLEKSNKRFHSKIDMKVHPSVVSSSESFRFQNNLKSDYSLYLGDVSWKGRSRTKIKKRSP